MAILFVSDPIREPRGVQIHVNEGKLVIRHLPPLDEQVLHELTAAVSLIAQASQFRDYGLRVQFEQLAQAIVDRHPAEIERYLAEEEVDPADEPSGSRRPRLL
jgi:hypothetical protein